MSDIAREFDREGREISPGQLTCISTRSSVSRQTDQRNELTDLTTAQPNNTLQLGLANILRQLEVLPMELPMKDLINFLGYGQARKICQLVWTL
jgi:hypothetical protein